MTISASQNTTATLVATGSITITNGTTTITPLSGYPALLTQTGSISITGTGNSNPACLTANGAVYSGNNFTISGNTHTCTVTGSVVAQGAITIGGNGYSQSPMTVNYQSGSNLFAFTSNTTAMSVESYNV